MEIPILKSPNTDNLQRMVNIINGMIAVQENKTIEALAEAKEYADEAMKKVNVSEAKVVDEMPVYNDGTIEYKQAGESKTTTNLKTWFFFTDADDKVNQTIYIDGQWLSIKVANEIDFDDYLKIADIVSDYTGEELDKTKVPNLAALDALFLLTAQISDTTVAESTVWSSTRISKELALNNVVSDAIEIDTYEGGMIINEIAFTGDAGTPYGDYFAVDVVVENSDATKTYTVKIILPQAAIAGNKIKLVDSKWVLSTGSGNIELTDQSCMYMLRSFPIKTKVSCANAELDITYGSSQISAACLDNTRIAKYTLYSLANFQKTLLGL